MNAPKLRFPEFKGEWKTRKFYECVEIPAKLVDPSREEFQDYPHIGPGNIEKFTGKILSYKKVKDENLISGKFYFSEEDIIYGKINPQLSKVCYPKFEGLCSADAYPIRSIDGVMIPGMLFQLLLSKQFYKFATSVSMRTGMPKINRDELGQFSFTVPSIDEQTKVANFFDLIDKKILLQQKKIDLLNEQKKGYTQKLFKQEIRFKDAKGHTYPDWKLQIKAEQLFEAISNKNHKGEYPVLSASQEHGMVYRDSLDRQMSFNNDNLGSYKLIEPKDFIISLRSFQGGIEFSNLQGLVSPAYTIFRKKSDMVHELYFAKVFKTANFIMRLNATTYGIRDGKAISYKDFSTLKFDIPCLEEQIKIANFLDTFDKKIAHETTKLIQLTSQKQAFMQQMFI